MRTIFFSNNEDFDLLYQGFIIGGNTATQKTMQTVRREVKILDKFEAISNPLVSGDKYPTGDLVRTLVSSDQKLVLTTEEYELLKKYFESVPWVIRVSREVVRLADLIENAQES